MDAEIGGTTGMARNVDIPVGEQPMGLLRDQKNGVDAVAVGEFAEVVKRLAGGRFGGRGWRAGVASIGDSWRRVNPLGFG